jgi:excisionase family DNA binding protein
MITESQERSPPCFTVNEAARYLRISRSLLYELIHDGRIRTVKIGARTIIRGAELERFLDQQQAA